MTFNQTLSKYAIKARRAATGKRYVPPLARFEGGPPPASCGTSDLARIFEQHSGRAVNKWLHYLDIYERYMGPHRGTNTRMLEIGVFQGGSLEIWRNYLGDRATIFGIDINPECATYADAPNQVRIGSQDDTRFLASVLHEMGGLDIVLDDGSHIGRHQQASFEFLWPRMSPGGLYIIEDVHTAYFLDGFEGGYRRKGTAVEFSKGLIDDLHSDYHERGGLPDLGAMHFYDSMIFIQKRTYPRPTPVVAPADGKRVDLGR